MNPKIVFIVSVCVAAWALHDILAPGEAPANATLVMNWLALFGSTMGAIGSVMKMQKQKT